MFYFRLATAVALLPTAVLVAQAAEPVAAQVERAARAELARQASATGLVKPNFELELVAARAAPPCAQAVAIEALDTRQPARMRFAARCPDAGGWKYEYLVRARVSALVAVAAGPVAAGAVLSAAQVALERRDVSGVPDPIGAPELAVGQSSRRSLRPGELLRSGQLAGPVLVKRGDEVLMMARNEGVEVSTSGEALDAGARGAIVRVRNSGSGQVVRVRVAGAGTVEAIGALIP